MRDLHNNIKVIRALSPVSVSDTTAQVTEIIDRQGFESLEFVITIGAVADVDATFTVLVEDDTASNMGTAAAVADSELIGTESGAGFATADDNTVRKIGYRGSKRYVRMTITPVSNASAALLGAVAILSNASSLPRSSQSA